jgi:hypothetical protein
MNLPIAPVIAAALGGIVALCALAVPTPMLEALVMASGLPAVFAAAEPPLGFTARAAIALGSGGFVAVLGWLGVSMLVGSREGEARQSEDPFGAPVIRRADAHPDAPPRPPLLATRDLGSPFRDPAPEPIVAKPRPVIPAEQPLPADLDQPLSAFDPDAVPDEPMPVPVALPSLRQASRPPLFEETERFEIFELTPPVRPTPSLVVDSTPEPMPGPPAVRDEAITRPETEATIHALLDRLEKGVVRKAIPPSVPAPAPGPAPRIERRARPRGLEDTLVTLRNLAQRA